ncbi:MAG: cytochrome c biogenesis CcdA family protein [Actinomycetota bacterium]|nr:cytochrome c biogenesis CcdA family protein [Actinomycetota bacterium]
MGELFDARAFALGMVALINPCGFALLPAYLGFFLGLEEAGDERRIVALNRAQLVGLSMSAGFLAVFGTLGFVFAGLGTTIQRNPWISTVIGAALVQLGIAMLFGFQPIVKIPKLEKGTGSRSIASMFLFGVSYAVASLSCTIALFLSAVGTSSSGASYASRFGGLLSYGLGMGLLATALTLAVAFGKRGLVTRFRQLLPRINFISAVILVVVGIYVALYGIWSTQVLNDPTTITPWINAIVTRAESSQTALASWIDARTTLLGWMFLILNLGLAGAGLVIRRPSAAPAR